MKRRPESKRWRGDFRRRLPNHIPPRGKPQAEDGQRSRALQSAGSRLSVRRVGQRCSRLTFAWLRQIPTTSGRWLRPADMGAVVAKSKAVASHASQESDRGSSREPNDPGTRPLHGWSPWSHKMGNAAARSHSRTETEQGQSPTLAPPTLSAHDGIQNRLPRQRANRSG